MNIKLIIVNYNDYQSTINYVINILNQKGINLNITIIDNCSKNKSFDIISDKFKCYDNVFVIKSEINGGYAKGNNLGISSNKFKTNDLLIISNNDLYIEDNYLFKKWADIHSRLDNVAISAPLMFVNNKKSEYSAWKIPTFRDSYVASLGILEKIFGDNKKYTFNDLNSFTEVDCVPGSLFMINYREFEKVNFFDNDTFLYMEEVIISRKLKDIGLKNYLISELKYEHFVSKTISSEVPSRIMRKYLIDSICYYHSTYDGTSKIKLGMLRLNYYIWILENYFVNFLRKKENH